jgi:hypothetical protein
MLLTRCRSFRLFRNCSSCCQLAAVNWPWFRLKQPLHRPAFPSWREPPASPPRRRRRTRCLASSVCADIPVSFSRTGSGRARHSFRRTPAREAEPLHLDAGPLLRPLERGVQGVAGHRLRGILLGGEHPRAVRDPWSSEHFDGPAGCCARARCERATLPRVVSLDNGREVTPEMVRQELGHSYRPLVMEDRYVKAGATAAGPVGPL